jgi:hypothetical protein
MAIGNLVPAVAYSYSLFSSPIGVSVDDFRIAALLLVMVCLLRILGTLRTKTPILESLIKIRREFLLGHVNTSTAVQQVEIALEGLRVDDILQEEVGGMLYLWSSAGAEIQKASEKIAAIQASVQAIRDGEEQCSKRVLLALQSLGESAYFSADRASEFLKRVDIYLERFEKRSLQLVRISREAGPDLRSILNQLKAAKREVVRQIEGLDEDLQEVLHATEEMVRQQVAQEGQEAWKCDYEA